MLAWGPDRWLVTLTIRNVTAENLPTTLRRMTHDFQAVKLAMRRSDRVKLVALRKLECTYNASSKSYHPHFHFVVKGEKARLLVIHWLSRQGDEASV